MRPYRNPARAGWTAPDDGEEYEEQYCGSCSGSGEGMWPGATCHACRGSGTEYVLIDKPQVEDEEE
jgi:DnaJ-class molecular chaperone